MTSEVQMTGFGEPATPPPASNLNVVTPMQRLVMKRSKLQRELKAVERDIEFLERKQALAEFVTADRINSGRLDIPSLAEVVEWDTKFRSEYRRLHYQRNAKALANTNMVEGEREVAEDPRQILADDAEVEEMSKLADDYAQIWAPHRGAGFIAAEPLVGQLEPRLSLLHPYDMTEFKVAFWAGAYQRIGLL